MEQKLKPYHECIDTFANQLRLRILDNLKAGPMSVNELSEKTGSERSNVSHSLQMLRLCNVVDVKEDGKSRIYFIKDAVILGNVDSGSILKAFDKHINTHCNYCHKIKKTLTVNLE
ncbi:TPA: winged helix-turn-helix transcriptional regulator [archaeon]|nr:winged helix-turn-helix transcriptional regulator [Candidatus Naiadarchaeales archaeon SRR2090159.bin1288]